MRLAQMSVHVPFMATMNSFDMSFQPSMGPGRIRDFVFLVFRVVNSLSS